MKRKLLDSESFLDIETGKQTHPLKKISSFENGQTNNNPFSHSLDSQPLFTKIFERYKTLQERLSPSSLSSSNLDVFGMSVFDDDFKTNEIDNVLQNSINIVPIVEQSIKILNKHLEKPDALIFSVGQSCAHFIFAAWALSNILEIGDPNKLLTVAFSGKYYCNACCLTGYNVLHCSISHAKNDFLFPSKEQIEWYTQYLEKINLLKNNTLHYIILDLVCHGSGLLSFIDLFKTSQGLNKNWSYETYFFTKDDQKTRETCPMVQTLEGKSKNLFINHKTYNKHHMLFDMLSANAENKNLRLVPEYDKKQWANVNPLEFIPHEDAQLMLLGIVHHVQTHKESLLKKIKKE